MDSSDTIIRRESETDPRYGKKPSDRSISEHVHKGFILLDKPSGPTSHQVCDWVKKIYELKKAGHSGTLDPKVTGLLPIALGDSTKALQAIFRADKEYVCLMKIHDDVSNSKLKKVLSQYQGVITQTPPVKSAVKRRARQRRIHYIKLIERKDRYALYRVKCEAGTYIRKLCHDMGETLGTGAHMRQLRRTQVAGFSEDETVILQDLRDSWERYLETGEESRVRETIKPMEYLVKDTPKIWVKDTAIDSITHGANLKNPGISRLSAGIKDGDTIAIMSLKNELVAIACAKKTSEEMLEENGMAADLKRVLMEPGVYPEIQN